MEALIFLTTCLTIVITIDTTNKRRNYMNQGKQE